MPEPDNAGQVPALAEVNPSLPAVVERYRAGESVQEIAKDCKVAARTIYRWMLSGLGDKEYYSLVTEALVDRIADADMALENAKNIVDVAKAKSAMRFSRMDLERRRPFLYGVKTEGPDNKVIVVVNRHGQKSVEIESERARENGHVVEVEPGTFDVTPGEQSS